MLNIMVLTGSPHKKGTTAQLADSFCRGAAETGHTIERSDVAQLQVHRCTGCGSCGGGKEPCVFQDDMEKIYSGLKKADLIVFVTPLYYHTMTAYLKTVIDRFYAVNSRIKGGKGALLIAAAAASEPWNFDALKAWFQTELRYLSWKNFGMICAEGCAVPADLKQTNYPEQAWEKGRMLPESIEISS